MELIKAKNEKSYNKENLSQLVSPDNDLKNFLVEYTGEFLNLEEGSEITVEHLVDVVAKEFPEFLLSVAEENWVRGYQQALQDVDNGMTMHGMPQSEENSE
jgi:hypothetical protein